MPTPMSRRALRLITIGESPRDDIVSEMRSWWPEDIEIEQVGVLDGLSDEEVAAMAPTGKEARLVSQRRDGCEVIMRKQDVEARLNALVSTNQSALTEPPTALLCTGRFEGIKPRGIWLEAQTLVDHAAETMAKGLTTLGVVVPLKEQIADVTGGASVYQDPTRKASITHASPYSAGQDDWKRAANDLSQAELIVMHCMGYTLSQKKRITELTGKPVLLAREIVATALSWLVTR